MLRHVERVTATAEAVWVDVQAVSATTLGAMPGWLTGEPFEDQGVETTMPNLPEDITVPPLDPEEWRLKISVHGPRTVRLVAAPRGSRVFEEKAGWLGIVTDESYESYQVHEADDIVEVSGESFSLTVTKYPFALVVKNTEGRTVARTSDRLRQVAGFPVAPPILHGQRGLSLNMELAGDESILGFGEMFGRVEKNGQHLELRTDDALGTGTGLCYKPVPVWHSSAGYGAFINTGAAVTADVGHRQPSVLGLGVEDEAIDLFLFISDDPAQRLADYTTLTGPSVVPPVWAFGYWMGRCRYHSRREMVDVSEGLTARGIPCDVLHLDPDWLVVDRLNTDFIWNEERFGSRHEFIMDLFQSGRRLSLWELPYVDPASPVYPELESRGYLVRSSADEPAALEGTPTPDGRSRGLIDFSNPDARRWWKDQHRAFLDDGVAVFKTDFGEGFPREGVVAADIPSTHLHNLYPLWYNAATSEAIAELTDRDPLVWGRSGWAGSHRYPGQWGGDAESTTAGMRATLRGGLSYALSAPGFWSHDIGGFFGPELTPGLYVRWTQFGAFSPLMRAHGLRPREPWEFGEQALHVTREWIRRRYEMLPYLWQQAHMSVREGLPMMRPLYVAFPQDPVARVVDDTFMLGQELLIVPVFDDSAEPVSRTFYVPDGEWLDMFTGEHFAGGQHHTVHLPLDAMPVLVRSGTSIPALEMPDGASNTDDVLYQPWHLRVFGGRNTVRGARPRDLVDFHGDPVDTRSLPARHVF